MIKKSIIFSIFLTYFFSLLLIFTISSNAQNFNRQPTPNDTLVSPKLISNNQVKFSIYAPMAETVRFSSSDIPSVGWSADMTKQENGVWNLVIGPVSPGAYRYQFMVDGVSVIDPRSPSISESNMNAWSLVYIPGADFMETKNVTHGAVAEVTYYSTSLKKFRRMHIYTPPGYESGDGKFPIFYLLHGALDCDDSWTTVGRAGFIFDNLIATEKAKPMVVVMPAGHTGPFRFGQPLVMDDFIQDFQNDIMPYVEKHYRVYTDKQNRALAGLSMGGAQTLNIAEKFSYIGVFSSGIFGIVGPSQRNNTGPSWEEQHKELLENPNLKEELKLVWFATGSEDFLVETSRATVELLRKYGFDVVYKETGGGHTWINWREYLNEFTPLLFK